MKNFAITGIAGYIAPRHLKAIKDTGNDVVAAMDPHDSVGILDGYFPDVSFFTQFERFDRHLEMLKRNKEERAIDYMSICSPNFLHDAHIRLALRVGADAICEKPLVLNPWNIDALAELEEDTGKRVYNTLQLRLHDTIIDLRNKIKANPSDKKRKIKLSYITSRGKWYNFSWKGDVEKSGGVATNIGIHFFDMLMWMFGKVQSSTLHLNEKNRMAGFIELPDAEVQWFLSTDERDLPKEAVAANMRTFRSITIDGEEIEFTKGFTDLHTRVYQDVLNGGGFGLEDARPSIELVHALRNAPIELNKGELHPMINAR
jgi:UDP-N-acetyl-2-amino-2-deoxyglucuronate dehydrogenase